MNTFAAAISGAVTRKARPLQTDGTSQPEHIQRFYSAGVNAKRPWRTGAPCRTSSRDILIARRLPTGP